MGLSESSKLYLENYYLLDQARSEVHKYLEGILTKAADEFEEYLKNQTNDILVFKKYVQKDGGNAVFFLDRKDPIPGLEALDQWKFSIEYRDATRSVRISSPSKCKVFCSAPKNVAKQRYELNRMTNQLGLPDLFRVEEIDILTNPEDEVVTAIKEKFIEFYDQFVQTVEGLIKEGSSDQGSEEKN